MKQVLDLKNTGRKHFYAAAAIDDVLYFSDWWSKGLFRTQRDSNEVELLDVFKSSNYGKLHSFAFSFENQVWFVPRTAEDNIAVYDTKDGKMEYLELPGAGWLGQYELFKNYYIVGETVWLIPYSYDTLLTINLKNKKIERVKGIIENKKEIGYPKFIGSCLYEGKIYLCPWDYDKVVVVTIDTMSIEELDLNISSKKYRNVFACNQKLYFISYEIEKGILEYDLVTQEATYIELEENISGKYCAAYYDKENHKLVLFPYVGQDILLIDAYTWKSKGITIYVDGNKKQGNPYWCDVRKIGNQIWIIAEESGFSELICETDGIKGVFSPVFPRDMIMQEFKLMLNEPMQKKKETKNIGAIIYEIVSKQ